MDSSPLKSALMQHDQASRHGRSAALSVWEALSKADPELAAEILHLFSTVEAAANWVTSDLDEANGSPAYQVAEGRSAEVLSRLRKAAHGFAS
jgi:hypothetical protein